MTTQALEKEVTLLKKEVRLLRSTVNTIISRKDPGVLDIPEKEVLNAKTRRELIKISKDIEAGRNLVGPFKTVEEMKAYLEA